MKNQNWSIYFKENLILGNSASEAGLVTLWTPVEKIIKKLDKNLFFIAGQLYSKDGINYLLRNILANPSIRYLIICGQDLSGSGKALINFFQKGVAENYNIVDSDFATIHKEIPKDSLELLRQNVKIKNLIGISDPERIANELKSCPKIGRPFAEPQTFPERKIEKILTFPTDYSVFKLKEKYIGPAWLRILKLILRFGVINKTWYGNEVRELFNIAAVVSEENPLEPKMFPYFQVSEGDIKKYQANVMKGDKGDEIYTYGERLWNYKGINQVEEVVIPFLKKYPTDRAALAVTFDMTQDHKAPRSPCLCLVQATTLGDQLNLTAYFRSHAIFSGWVLNAFGLRQLQYYIAEKLSKKPGILTIFSNCAHIYDNEWRTAEEIVEKYYPKEFKYPFDPRGYFVIKIEGKEIVAQLYSPRGEFLEEFRQDGLVEKAAIGMFQKLILAEAISEISHAFDLGAELQKAEIAIKNNLKYTQDKELIF